MKVLLFGYFGKLWIVPQLRLSASCWFCFKSTQQGKRARLCPMYGWWTTSWGVTPLSPKSGRPVRTVVALDKVHWRRSMFSKLCGPCYQTVAAYTTSKLYAKCYRSRRAQHQQNHAVLLDRKAWSKPWRPCISDAVCARLTGCNMKQLLNE